MQTMTDRAPLFQGTKGYNKGPTLYTQTPEFKQIKQGSVDPWSLKLGRDNSMYSISEGYNLNSAKPQN